MAGLNIMVFYFVLTDARKFGFSIELASVDQFAPAPSPPPSPPPSLL